MFKKQLLILFVIVWLQNSSCFLSSLTSFVKEGFEIAKLLNDIKSTKDTVGDISSILSNTIENKEILESLEKIDHKLDDFKSYTRDKLNRIELLINTLADEMDIRSKRTVVESFVTKINNKWEKLRDYLRNGSSVEMFDHWANKILDSTEDRLLDFRGEITPLLVTRGDEGFFTLMEKHGHDKRDILCDEGTTSHHNIARLFEIVVITEMRAHVLLTFANILKWSTADGWKVPVNRLRTNLVQQLKRYIDVFLKSLNTTELPYLRACDPKVWQKDVNYYALDGFLQQTIYSLYSSGFEGSGGATCEQLGRLHNRNQYAHMNTMTRHSECDGVIDNCNALYTSWGYGAYVCFWSWGPYRIRWVEHYGKKLGTDISSSCPENDRKQVSWVTNSETNTFCSCRCSSKRWKFDTRIMMSRVNDNYVIVGMRINRNANILHIQIAEGKLESNGYISNFSWVPSTRRTDAEWAPNWGILPVEFTDMDVFFFDDLQLRAGHVLTGVQFAQASRDKIKGFTIRVHGQKFDYETGKLDLDSRDDPQPLNPKANLELEYSAKNPVNMKPNETSSPNSQGYTHIVLRQSDLSDDYGQSTLPLFDGVPILTNPLSPIGGVGLFHKAPVNYAGFISLRIFPINYTYYVNTFLQTHNLTSLLT